jgi:hypothetical protein
MVNGPEDVPPPPPVPPPVPPPPPVVPLGRFRLQELANTAMIRRLANTKALGATFLTVILLRPSPVIRISGGVMPIGLTPPA